jgi:hypothetical protein
MDLGRHGKGSGAPTHRRPRVQYAHDASMARHTALDQQFHVCCVIILSFVAKKSNRVTADDGQR